MYREISSVLHPPMKRNIGPYIAVCYRVIQIQEIERLLFPLTERFKKCSYPGGMFGKAELHCKIMSHYHVKQEYVTTLARSAPR